MDGRRTIGGMMAVDLQLESWALHGIVGGRKIGVAQRQAEEVGEMGRERWGRRPEWSCTSFVLQVYRMPERGR